MTGFAELCCGHDYLQVQEEKLCLQEVACIIAIIYIPLLYTLKNKAFCIDYDL